MARTKPATLNKQGRDSEGYDVTDQKQAGRPGGTRRGRGRSARQPASQPAGPQPTRGPSGLPLLRTSERGTFKRCRFLYRLEYVDLLKPNIESPPLMFGSMVHIALAGYYRRGIRRGPHPAGLFEQAIDKEAVRVAKLIGARPHDCMEYWRDRIEMGIGMMNNYVESYGKDDEWRVLATEVPFKIVVDHPVRKTPWFYYTGILDNVLENRSTKKLFIRDHKTTSAIQTKYLALDEQTTSYWAFGIPALKAARIVPPGVEIQGIEFNFLRKAKPDERPYTVENGRKYFLNNDGSISKKQPAPYFERTTVWRHQMEQERVRRRAVGEFADMEQMRRDLADGAEDAAAYKNPTKTNCPGCWAFDICELHEAGANWQELRDLTTHVWDPYEAHEIFLGETH